MAPNCTNCSTGPDGGVPQPLPSEEYISGELVELKRSVQSALECEATNYYPVDVLCWATRDTFKAGALSDEAAATLVGDCLSALTVIDPETLEPGQAGLYHSKFAEIASLASDHFLAEQQLKKLEAYDEPLAAFFYALKVSGFINNEPDQEGVQQALKHLRRNPSGSKMNAACALPSTCCGSREPVSDSSLVSARPCRWIRLPGRSASSSRNLRRPTTRCLRSGSTSCARWRSSTLAVSIGRWTRSETWTGSHWSSEIAAA